MKPSGLIRKSFDSITVKIIALMVLFILPLNIGLIMTSMRAAEAVRHQTTLSLQHVVRRAMQQLDNQIFSTNYFLFDLDERNPYFIRLQEREMDNAYMLAKTNTAAEFSRAVGTLNAADAYYYISNGEQRDDLLTMPGTSFGLNAPALHALRQAVFEMLQKENADLPARWRVVEAGGWQWLLRIHGDSTFSYGGLISLDLFKAQVLSNLSYQSLKLDFGVSAEEQSGRILVSAPSSRIPLELSLSVSLLEVEQGLPQVRRLSVFLAFLSLAIIPLFIFILSRILLKPLNKIRSALLRLKSGDDVYRIGPHRQYSEQFRTINQSFNEMADNIKSLTIANYEKELANQRLAFRSLQLHIRPHFLLNTFNLVHSLAQIKEYQGIQALTLYLSDYFRYLFRSGKELEPFEKELALIRKYLEVSKIRYPQAFVEEIEVEPSALEAYLPPLLIHSLVENIITHALIRGRLIKIILKAYCQDGRFHFVLMDDGKGMDADLLLQLTSPLDTAAMEGQNHLGIRNSVQRLRHVFGEDVQYLFESSPGQGMKIMISMPFIEGKEDHLAEDVDGQ